MIGGITAQQVSSTQGEPPRMYDVIFVTLWSWWAAGPVELVVFLTEWLAGQGRSVSTAHGSLSALTSIHESTLYGRWNVNGAATGSSYSTRKRAG